MYKPALGDRESEYIECWVLLFVRFVLVCLFALSYWLINYIRALTTRFSVKAFLFSLLIVLKRNDLCQLYLTRILEWYVYVRTCKKTSTSNHSTHSEAPFHSLSKYHPPHTHTHTHTHCTHVGYSKHILCEKLSFPSRLEGVIVLFSLFLLVVAHHVLWAIGTGMTFTTAGWTKLTL